MTRHPLGRLLLDEPVVLYRRQDGTALALEDRCCHRQLPLSMGLKFDASGKCIEIPGQDSIPPQARVRS